MARILAQHGPGSTNADVHALARAIAAFAPGLLGYGLVAHLGRALYARGHGRVAASATVAGWVAVIVADIALVSAIARADTVPALALGNSIGMTVAGFLLGWALLRTARLRCAVSDVLRSSRSLHCIGSDGRSPHCEHDGLNRPARQHRNSSASRRRVHRHIRRHRRRGRPFRPERPARPSGEICLSSRTRTHTSPGTESISFWAPASGEWAGMSGHLSRIWPTATPASSCMDRTQQSRRSRSAVRVPRSYHWTSGQAWHRFTQRGPRSD